MMLVNASFEKNLAIMASAGTGKTYQLAMRYINLLLSGAKPEEIVAITFSKKAAGEIFDKIISQLLELIRDEKARQNAVSDGFIPSGTGTESLLEILRVLLSSRRKLHIETNDSFLMQLIQAAPSEFGISGAISMIDEKDDRPRQRALLQTLHSPLLAGSEDQCREWRQRLYQILRDSSFGNDKANIYVEITSLLKNYYRIFLNYPEIESWNLKGSPEVLPESLLSRDQLAELRAEFNGGLHSPEYEDIRSNVNLFNNFEKFMAEAEKTSVENTMRPVAANVKFFFNHEGVGPGFDVLRNAAPLTFSYQKKEYVIEEELLTLLQTLARHLLAAEYVSIQKKTVAIYLLMKLFDASYNDLTRKTGKLTFADILYLINRMDQEKFGKRQVLQERLALTVNHYLLDEFQDTSTMQWQAFRELMLDVIQTREPDRFSSFFMVGDVKQSIYQWREGNPELFMQICREQRFLPQSTSGSEDRNGALRELFCSYRSTEPVLKSVNDIFGRYRELRFPDRLSKSVPMFVNQCGEMRFLPHQSGLKPNVRDVGCSMLFEVPVLDKTDDPDLQIYRMVCSLIRLLNPFEPGKKPKSVAVLFRRNDNITACYEVMKQLAPELNVTMEGALRLKDSSTYALFRQCLRLAAHPGDVTAPCYFRMLRSDVSASEFQERLYPGETGSLSALIRQDVEQGGIAAFFQRFRTALPEIAQEPEYLDLLESALAMPELEQGLDPDEMITLLDTYEGNLTSMDRTVQLMTIHKSKGLGFDIVILPDNAPGEGNHGNGFTKDEENNLVYFEPNAAFLPYFPEAAAHAEREKNRDCYEDCCNLYVAMTRAKYGLYMFIPQEKEKSVSKTMQHADILRAALKTLPLPDGCPAVSFAEKIAKNAALPASSLSVLYCVGDPGWMTALPEESGKKTENPAVCAERNFRAMLEKTIRTAKPVTVRTASAAGDRSPSDHEGFVCFDPMTGAEIGTEVHEALARLEWAGSPEENQEFLESLDVSPHAGMILKRLFRSPGIVDALKRPDAAGGVRLYREQPFLMKQNADGGVINGIIDRAVVICDENGRPVRAEVLDYKTDKLDDPEEFRSRYESQLSLYRDAVARLTGLPEAEVNCTILALYPGLVIRL